METWQPMEKRPWGSSPWWVTAVSRDSQRRQLVGSALRPCPPRAIRERGTLHYLADTTGFFAEHQFVVEQPHHVVELGAIERYSCADNSSHVARKSACSSQPRPTCDISRVNDRLGRLTDPPLGSFHASKPSGSVSSNCICCCVGRAEEQRVLGGGERERAARVGVRA
jgi:hypothetical protein